MLYDNRKPVIMIVENEPELCELGVSIAHGLGYMAFACSSAEEAVERIGECDLVFTDIMLSGKSGIDLIREIRAAGNDIPIVATSGLEENLFESRNAGANASIPKPWLREDLRRTFAELIG